jgi:hypothetical protein
MWWMHSSNAEVMQWHGMNHVALQGELESYIDCEWIWLIYQRISSSFQLSPAIFGFNLV